MYGLVPTAALYGPNASGKSNFLAAISFMREAVIRSHRFWAPEGGVPQEPFAWGRRATEPSLYEMTFIVGPVRYQYGFVLDGERFLEEWLYAWPGSRKQTWLERDGNHFKFGDHMKGENRLVEQVTRPNALFISAAVQLRHEQLAPVFQWFDLLQVTRGGDSVRSGDPLADGQSLWHLLETGAAADTPSASDQTSSQSRLDAFRHLIRTADVGIVDFKLVADEAMELALPDRGAGGRVVVHHHAPGGDGWLPLSQESQGTLTLFRLGPYLLEALSGGGLLVIDELEASLHPLLALKLVCLFNDPKTNPRDAQLVFSTHDTNLLGNLGGNAPLRRDQIWLSEKNAEGATTLFPLTDYKPRKTENLERGYLQGRYGASPFLGQFSCGEG